MRRRAPRPVGLALGSLTATLAPATLLADVQRTWPAVVGPVIAANARPTAARDGVVTVSCDSAVWAQELDLMAPEIVGRLNEALDGNAIARLRMVALGRRDGY